MLLGKSRGGGFLTDWYYGPRYVECHIVDPVVHKLRPAMGVPPEVVFKRACPIVERDAVQMPDAHRYLQDIAPGLALHDGQRGSEAEGTPDELEISYQHTCITAEAS